MSNTDSVAVDKVRKALAAWYNGSLAYCDAMGSISEAIGGPADSGDPVQNWATTPEDYSIGHGTPAADDGWSYEVAASAAADRSLMDTRAYALRLANEQFFSSDMANVFADADADPDEAASAVLRLSAWIAGEYDVI